MSRYTSATETDRQEMLAAIGVESIDDLFADVPEGVRLGRPLDIAPGKPEQEVFARLRDLAAKNVSAEDEISFLGAGMYDHYVPALIDSIISRSEFLTPYTPYQPEISQGGLQVMFEYQTAISELTGLPVSNASVYEGPSAVAAAGTRSRRTRSGCASSRPRSRTARRPTSARRSSWSRPTWSPSARWTA
jgi:glycine dehydrogenase subunit 1